MDNNAMAKAVVDNKSLMARIRRIHLTEKDLSKCFIMAMHEEQKLLEEMINAKTRRSKIARRVLSASIYSEIAVRITLDRIYVDDNSGYLEAHG